MRPALPISVLLATLVLAGCAGYRLGPTNGSPAGARSIQVAYFQNETMEPRLAEAVAHALRKRLQQDGTFRLATQNDGDVIVKGAILRYEREALSFQPADVITVRDYEITLYCRVLAEERGTGKVLLDQVVRGRTTLRVGADQTSVERQSLPILADDFARNAVDLLVDGTW
ncbi:MAG: hypothetical protein IPM17_12320 [Verrucomicrobia bacterium]|nr:hypothetical protein [Verrucomicrobiota bacterium]